MLGLIRHVRSGLFAGEQQVYDTNLLSTAIESTVTESCEWDLQLPPGTKLIESMIIADLVVASAHFVIELFAEHTSNV